MEHESMTGLEALMDAAWPAAEREAFTTYWTDFAARRGWALNSCPSATLGTGVTSPADKAVSVVDARVQAMLDVPTRSPG